MTSKRMSREEFCHLLWAISGSRNVTDANPIVVKVVAAYDELEAALVDSETRRKKEGGMCADEVARQGKAIVRLEGDNERLEAELREAKWKAAAHDEIHDWLIGDRETLGADGIQGQVAAIAKERDSLKQEVAHERAEAAKHHWAYKEVIANLQLEVARLTQIRREREAISVTTTEQIDNLQREVERLKSDCVFLDDANCAAAHRIDELQRRLDEAQKLARDFASALVEDRTGRNYCPWCNESVAGIVCKPGCVVERASNFLAPPENESRAPEKSATSPGPTVGSAATGRSSGAHQSKGEEARKTACNYYCSEYVRLVDELARKDAALRDLREALDTLRIRGGYVAYMCKTVTEMKLEGEAIERVADNALRKLSALLSSTGEVGGE